MGKICSQPDQRYLQKIQSAYLENYQQIPCEVGGTRQDIIFSMWYHPGCPNQFRKSKKIKYTTIIKGEIRLPLFSNYDGICL